MSLWSMGAHRRVWVAGIVVGAVAAFGLLVAQVWVFRTLSWTHREPLADSFIGFNFSCDQAEYLLLEDPEAGPDGYVDDRRPGRAAWCAETLERLIGLTGARHVRLSVPWDEVEPRPGAFDFETLDAQLAVAERRGATVSLSVGMKAQRHPEFYIPAWAVEGLDLPRGVVLSDNRALRQRALRMVVAVVRHVGDSPVVDSWGAENEGYIASPRSNDWTLSREYVAEVAATIREHDPLDRPVAINHAQHFVMDRRWKDALADGDILGQSLYPFRNYEALGRGFVVNIMEIGPLMPNYAYQAREARAAGKQLWVTELQAEPWTDEDARLVTPEDPSPNLSPGRLATNIAYARRTGAERIYLWGAEWWLYEGDRFGDWRWVEQARAAVRCGEGR
ncbi:MAG: beta-galactosidase [Dehalococcoidia bacterium]|nr:beta-galactosidase [Dehalococcoidia bacterium]